MHPALSRQRTRIATCLLACWLALALSIGGFAQVRVAMLGTQHLHRPAAAASPVGAQAMVGWQDFRRAAHGGTAQRHHEHPQGLFERHHHAPGDATVASLDSPGEATASGDAPATAVVLASALPSGVVLPATEPDAGVAARWAEGSARGIERIEAGRLERPPRA